MQCIVTDNVDLHHLARVVETELEPSLRAKVCRETVETTAIVGVVIYPSKVVVCSNDSSSRMLETVRDVSFPIDIRGLDDPAIVRGREVDGCIGAGVGSAHVIPSHPPVVAVKGGIPSYIDIRFLY